MTTTRAAGIDVQLGSEELNEPFACWTEGPFGVTSTGDSVYALSPINASAADQWVWTGPSVDDLRPLHPMTGLATRCHTLRSHTFDADWWPINLWIDDEGTWHSFMHAEDFHRCDTGQPGWGADLRTVAEWTSRDQGQTWDYQGIVLSIDRRFAVPGSLQREWPRNGGTGDQKLVVDSASGYLYLLYTVFTYQPYREDVDNAQGHLAIARAPITSRGSAGSWRKWYRGSYSEPGDGGSETWIMSPSYGDPDNSQRAVVWDRLLGCWVMAFVSRTSEARIAFSDDLIRWTPSKSLYSDPSGINYTNLIAFGPGGSDQVTHGSMWFYYTRRDYHVYRRPLTFDRTASLPPASTEGSGSYRASEGFGSQQGANRWSYMYEAHLTTNTSEYWSPMRRGGVWESPQGDALIGPAWQRTSGPQCARSWRAAGAGRVHIEWHRLRANPGTKLRVLHNRSRIWPDSEWSDGLLDSPHSLQVEVRPGDRVIFALNGPGTVTWDPLITYEDGGRQ